jgi:hypothetical protein
MRVGTQPCLGTRIGPITAREFRATQSPSLPTPIGNNNTTAHAPPMHLTVCLNYYFVMAHREIVLIGLSALEDKVIGGGAVVMWLVGRVAMCHMTYLGFYKSM